MFNEQDLQAQLAPDQMWGAYLASAAERHVSIHLAVFAEPYLGYVLDGRKTVESRFTIHRIAPFGNVQGGDIVLVKAAGGPILGICRVAGVWYYKMNVGAWEEIQQRFGDALCIDDAESFVKARRRAVFGTLLKLTDVRTIEAIDTSKRDRRGWVVLRDACAPPSFPGFGEAV